MSSIGVYSSTHHSVIIAVCGITYILLQLHFCRGYISITSSYSDFIATDFIVTSHRILFTYMIYIYMI